jgi:aldose 1-epimerase
MRLTKNHFYITAWALIFNFSCSQPSKTKAISTTDSLTNVAAVVPDSAAFKSTIDGKQVGLFILKNKSNASVAITNYGGRLVSLMVPDSKGKLTDVILGYDSLKSYQKLKEPYFGAIIGRYGNRIAKGKFSMDGKAYQLDVNDGVNTLHGGFKGFYSRVFVPKQINANELQLTYTSADGEGGYPGTLSVKVTYTLSDDNALKIAAGPAAVLPTPIIGKMALVRKINARPCSMYGGAM